MRPSKIKSLLVEKEITQKEIAQSVGVSPMMISQVVKKRSRSYRVERYIAERLGLPYEELWGSEPRRRAA